MRQDVLICLMLAYGAAETFVNVFFRTLVEQPGHSKHRRFVLEALERRTGLEKKLKTFPAKVLGVRLDPSKPTVAPFYEIKELRNQLMHFTTSHQTYEMPDGVRIHGLADTTAYHRLSSETAMRSMEATEGLLAELLRLAGVPEQNIPHGLHQWTGKPPI